MDRIDFEELALTSLDLSMGPQLTGSNPTAQAEEEKKTRVRAFHTSIKPFCVWSRICILPCTGWASLRGSNVKS